MILKLTLNNEFYTKHVANGDESAREVWNSTEKLLNESNTEHGFSFLSVFGEMSIQCGARDVFNELQEEYGVSLEDYGYAESENEVVQFLNEKFGDKNPNEYAVNVRLLPDNASLHEHGSFIKNGVNTGHNYKYWFDKNRCEPHLEYPNYFVGITVWKVEKKRELLT